MSSVVKRLSRGCQEGVKSCQEGVKSCEEGVKSCQEGHCVKNLTRKVSRVVTRVPSGRQAHVTKVSRGCQEGVTKEHCVEGVKRASGGRQEGQGFKRVLQEC